MLTNDKPADTQRLGGQIWLLVAVCAAVLIVGTLLQYYVLWTDEQAQTVLSAASDSEVRFNEAMSSNVSAHLSDTGEYSDWLEIINTGSTSVNLRGYTLRQADNQLKTLTFPDFVLAPGEVVLIYADDINRNNARYPFHAPFKLSASGESLELLDASGALADSLELPTLNKNQVYRRLAEGEWQVSHEYTPGLANTREGYLSLTEVFPEGPIEISEVMASNATYAADSEGRYHDYVELHNTAGEPVSLSGYFLSDDISDPQKWVFPEGTTIEANGYLLIYASGLNGTGEGELHTSFKLSNDGEEVLLSNQNRTVVARVAFPALSADQAYSLVDGEYTTVFAPTPGLPNTSQSAVEIEREMSNKNQTGLFITEILASAGGDAHDWLEIHNSTDQVLSLSDYGLSDDASRPRKWQFPAGVSLNPGEYRIVQMSGLSGKTRSGVLNVGFKLSIDGGYGVTLSTPAGEVVDRVFVPKQYTGVSYARTADGQFLYAAERTPAAPNNVATYQGRLPKPVYSVGGGLYENGQAVTLTLLAPPGARIYYTLDCSEPTEASALYSGPITINETTVVRTRAYAEGMLPSFMESQTYFFGVEHTVRVVSLVSDYKYLFGEELGIHTNHNKNWEQEGHVEVYSSDGSLMLSENCGLKLHGAASRNFDQKGFKVNARSEYGANRFKAPLFTNRPYTEYSSFVLRCSSEDRNKTRMRDSILSALAKGTSVFYQETELCVVYINGEYWGHYNMRERISAATICQYEGWEGQEDNIDLVRGNKTVMRGSDESYQEIRAWVKQNGVLDDAALARVGEVIDLDNFIAYHALQMFVGNADTLNVKRYRNAAADGKWRWVVYDLDWGFVVDTDSVRRWLDPAGMGSSLATDNTLFIGLMKNPTFRDRFLTFMGERLATDWTTERILSDVAERDALLAPELPAQQARWGQNPAKYDKELAEFIEYAKTRPTKLLGYFKEALSLSDDDMEKYFGAAMRLIQNGA